MLWALLIAAVGLGALGVFVWIGKREYRVTNAQLQRLYSLSESNARAQALRLLETPGLFQCRPASSPLKLTGLPSSVVDVLSQYDEIAREEFWVGREALTQPAALPGYKKIGSDFEFEEILVREGSDEIHLSYGPKHKVESVERIPSLWHKVILASNVPLP